MKILIANPIWRKGKRLGVRAGSRWPFTMEVKEGTNIPSYIPFPFFLAYAAAVLEKNDVDVWFIDAVAEGIDEGIFLSKVKDYNPGLVLLETSTPSIYADLAIAQEIKKMTFAKIALCGPHASIFGKEILENNPFVDYILVGEYEYTLLDLAMHFQSGQDLNNVAGLVYRRDIGTIQANSRRPLIQNLDELPWPARHFLPMHNYADRFCDMPHPSLQMWASRGCPYQCIFCMWPEIMYGGREYRIRNPKDVVDEISFCVKKWGFKSVYFDDDVFNIGKKRIIQLSEEIKKIGIDIPWAIMARADTSDYETFKAMKNAGLYALKFGIESSSQDILDNSGKNLKLEKVRETIKMVKSLGIKIHLTFTFGLPGETKETIIKTINYALKMDPDSVQFSLCVPFPGTKYFEIVKKQGFLLTDDWTKYDGYNRAVIRTEELNPYDLEKGLLIARKKWKTHLLKNAVIKNKWEYLKKGLSNPVGAIKKLIGLIEAWD